MKPIIFLLLATMMISCKNQIRKELESSPKSFSTLRNFGSSKNDTILSEAQKIEPMAEIEELKKSLTLQDADLNRIIEKTKLLGRTHYLLGLKYKEVAMYSDAVESFKRAIEKDSLNSRLYYEAAISQAQVALAMSEEAEEEAMRLVALKFMEKAVALDSKNSDSLFALATLYSHFYERYQEADKLMALYSKQHPSSIESLFLQGYIAAGLGENQRAAGYYDTIAKQNSIDPIIKRKAIDNRDLVLMRIQ